MNIELSQIKPSPKPIRTTWDEDKMNELAQSIKEQGLIVPIKVRPADEDAEVGYDEDVMYEIVYGHRRLEAMRIAGFTETDAIVEGVDDDTALLQQIIENELNEEVPAIDRANGFNRGVKQLGSVAELSRQTGINELTIRDSLRLLREPIEIQTMVTRASDHRTPSGKITPEHVAKVTGFDDEVRKEEFFGKKQQEEDLPGFRDCLTMVLP